MKAKRFSSFVSLYLIFELTIFSVVTLCNGSSSFSQNVKPGMPEIKFNAAGDVSVERILKGITYLNSSSNRFYLTLECNAFYPIYWITEDAILKQFNVTLRLNKRILPSPTNFSGMYIFTTIISVKIDQMKPLEEITFHCKSVDNSCMNNTLYVHKQYRDSPHITLVSTVTNYCLTRQHKNCPWNHSTESEKKLHLKSYPILSQENDVSNNKSCDDILHIHINGLSESQSRQFIPENHSMIIRCRSQKGYLSQGGWFGYRLTGQTEIIPLKNTTENDSGDYYETFANISVKEEQPIQQVYCTAPLWNSYSWCNTTVILKTHAEIELTASTGYSFTEAPKKSVSLLNNNNSFNSDYNYSTTEDTYNFTDISDNSNDIGGFTADETEPEIVNSTYRYPYLQNYSKSSTEEANDAAPAPFVSIIMLIAVGSITLLIVVFIIFIILTIIKRKRESNRMKEYLPELRVLMAPKNISSNKREKGGCHEIVKDSLTIDENCVLGQGTFGVVYKAVLRAQSIAYDVAVKTSKNDSEFAINSLQKELKVIAKMKRHINIVQLIGAVTEELENGNLYIVLEYCSNGNLREYLRKHKTSFENIVLVNNAVNIQQLDSKNFQGNYVLSTTLLVSWSLDIARGMQFLSSHNIVHGDLACRNVLLCIGRVAKLTDFGLAKQLEEYYYINKKEVPMPWKWMAYESLQYQKFSARTDIWSYGITMWEIFSLGDSPWLGCQWGEEFLEALAAGVRPKKPEYAPDEIYQIMKQCWRIETVLRPNFNESAMQLENILKKFISKENEKNCTVESESIQEQLSEYDNYLIPIKAQ